VLDKISAESGDELEVKAISPNHSSEPRFHYNDTFEWRGTWTMDLDDLYVAPVEREEKLEFHRFLSILEL